MNKFIKSNPNTGGMSEYSFKDATIVCDRRKFIPNICKNKSVISIGCVDMIDTINLNETIRSSNHQFFNISKVASKCVGIDINQDGINKLQELNLNAFYCDIMNDTLDIFEEEYDICVVSHVIEHVPDIHRFMSSILTKIKFKHIIIAVPSAYYGSTLGQLLLTNVERSPNDHYYTFTPVTFIKFISSFDLRIKNFYMDGIDNISVSHKYKYLKFLNPIFRKFIFKKYGNLICICTKSK